MAAGLALPVAPPPGPMTAGPMPAPMMPGMMPPRPPMAMPMAPQQPPQPQPAPEPPVREIPEEEYPALFRKLRGWYEDDKDKWSETLDEARQDFDFVAGDQWDERTKNILKAQMRPASVFNITGAMIDAVSGYEVANRQEPRYIQRTPGAAAVSELTTSAARYFRDNTNAEHHESAAFRDTAICGLGWTETYIDFDDNPDGDYRKKRVSPLEMIPDRSACEDNLSDRKRHHRVRRMKVSDALELFPDADRGDLHAGWAEDLSSTEELHDERPDPYEGADEEFPDTRDITVVETEWIEFETMMRFLDPFSGREARLPADDFVVLATRMSMMGAPVPKGVRIRRKVWRTAYLGKALLAVTEPPVQGHFKYHCITGKRHETKRSFYGIVRSMRDPQQLMNKSLSTFSHILTTNAKGGVMAERGAFENDRKAAADWAKPDSITWLAQGGAAKVQPKPVGQANQQFFQLIDWAMSMGPRVTGLNPEFLGMQQNDQAGVLEYQRRQSSLAILASLFDNLKLYRVEHGKYDLGLIQQYLSDARLIRIAGPEQGVFLPLNRDMTLGEYEVIVDDAPSSPNQKEQTWAAIQPMMPLLGPAAQSNPAFAAELMKLAPIPESTRQDFSKALFGQNPQVQAQQMAAAISKQEHYEARINKDVADAELKRAQALKALADAQAAVGGMAMPTAFPPILEGPFQISPLPPQPPQGPMGAPGPQMVPPGAGGPPGAPQAMQQGIPQGSPLPSMARPGMPQGNGLPQAGPVPLRGPVQPAGVPGGLQTMPRPMGA